MIFLIILLIILPKCTHDSMQSIIDIKKLKIKTPKSYPMPFSRLPIRQVFDLSNLYNSTDPRVCQKAGQVINWGGRDEICQADDILTESKLLVLNQTLINVNKYISRMLKVIPIQEGFYLRNLTDVYVNPQFITDCDIHITVTSRPFGNTASLASSFYEFVDAYTGRPIQGAIIINAASIPPIAQNESSFDRIYFTTLLHELIHALGVSYRAIPSWIDPTTNESYNKMPIIEYSLTKYPHKVFRILQTKHVREFVVERFGIEYFASNVPAGLELEDGGGPGTFGSHPEARVYIDDMFVGLTIGQNYISKLVFALLADTGWYDVNFSMAEKSAWGVGESLKTGPLSTFPNSAPQLSFPPHYLCNISELDSDVCTYDFLGIALCKGIQVDCNLPANEEDQKFCEIREFTDPLNIGLRGKSDIHDYILYKAPYSNSRCADLRLNNDNAYKKGETYGGESMCYMSTLLRSSFSSYDSHHGACYRTVCHENGSMSVFVDSIDKLCTEENQILTFPGFNGEVICPNPNLTCGIRELYGVLWPTATPLPSRTAMPNWSDLSLDKGQIIIIAIFSSLIVVVIVFVVYSQIKQRKIDDLLLTRKNEEPNTRFHNTEEQCGLSVPVKQALEM